LGLRGQKDINRPELVEKYGYDTKFAMHAVRLGMMGCTLLATGKIYIPLTENQCKDLLDIRNGLWPLDKVINTVLIQEEYIGNSYKLKDRAGNWTLPDEPDYDAVERWMIKQYLEAWR
jgi:hypothetical protein